MTSAEQDIYNSVQRVQQTCEAMVRAHGDGTAFVVTFEDGSAARLSDVVTQGREALTRLAGIFGTTTSETKHVG